MDFNCLKLNDSKTEFLILGSQTDLAKITTTSVKVGGSDVTSSKSARNIGAYMDSALNLKLQITNTIKSCYAQIHSISKIRKYLTIDATKTIVHALITSRLDNLNSLLHKLPAYELDRLQKVQNNSARLIHRQPRENNITPTLKELHWLPIPSRIEYKILLLTYKSLNNLAPSYLSSLIQPYVPPRPLRSASKKLLCEHSSAKKYGERAFKNSTSTLWKRLPLDIKTSESVNIFKNKLKTHLFRIAYGE